MARENPTIPICFFKIILQTNLQTIKIPNKFTRSHGAGLPNPVMMKPPDGTAWKVFWKNINGEIWFQKGWGIFTQNYSLQHGCLVVFKYKEGSSELDVIILDKHAVEIDYDSSCDTFNDEDENLDQSFEILNDKKARQKSPLVSPRPHKKVRGEIKIKETSGRTTSMNSPKGNRAQEVAARFITSNPFFTILIKPNHLTDYQLTVPNLKGVIENKENYVTLKIGKRSWNVKLLRVSLLTAGWSLFASESGLQSGDVCVFEQINKQDLVFKVHVFSGKVNPSV